MIPEPEVLKRIRSRPSEWWAAIPSPASAQQSARAQKPGKTTSGEISEAPAAGNRGKAKQSVVGEVDEDEDEDGEPLKSRRRRRPSGTTQLQGSQASVKGKENNQHIARVVTDRLDIDTLSEGDRVPKKKQGRFSAGGEVNGRATEPLVDENVIKPKRGRPAASETAQPSGIGKMITGWKTLNKEQHGRSAGDMAMDLAKPRQRGHPSHTQDELEAAANYAANVHRVGKEPATGRLAQGNMEARSVRRGRSSNTEAEVQAIFEEAKRTRPKQTNRPSKNMTTSEQLSNLPAREQHTRRTRRSDIGMEGPSAQTQTSTRGRHSWNSLELQTAVSAFGKGQTKGKKRDGHISASDPNSDKPSTSGLSKSKKTFQSTADIAKSSVKGKHSKDTAKDDKGSRKRKGVGDPENSLQEIKRRRVEPPLADGNDAFQRAKLLDYQHLTPVIRLVSHQTLKGKWDPLPQGCILLISQFLSDIQGPVIVRLNDERRKNQANTALQMVSRKLLGKISRGLPFPGLKNHREDEFDFEKVLDRNRALESQLTPTLHSNELLESELGKEIDLLESEQAALVELEANAKRRAIIRKQNGRKIHPLLQSEDFDDGEDNLKIRTGLATESVSVSLSLDVPGSENLQAIFQELDGHVESIQGNIDQVKDVAVAVMKSKAAVQATMFDHLDGSEYVGVVLG